MWHQNDRVSYEPSQNQIKVDQIIRLDQQARFIIKFIEADGLI